MTGKVVLLTGSTAGIGMEAAHQLAQQGATLVCVARNEDKAASLVETLRSDSGNDDVSYLIGDLSRPAEVQTVARAFLEQHERLDVLFNNAGAMFTSRQLTPDDLECTFALNHLSYFVLTVALLDALKAAPAARVVSTSSSAHGRGHLGYLDDLQSERWKFGGGRAYGDSKLANIWFTVELARRLEGSAVTANCFHPGFVASQFLRNNGFIGSLLMTLSRPIQLSVSQGADTGVWLATSADVAAETGGYWFKRKRRKGTPAARDPQAPGTLWTHSERIVSDLLGKDWATAG